MNTFGEFLYLLRKEKGMTQAELAERLGVTNKAVSKWETGEAMPETSLLLPLSRIFGVSVDELLDGKRKPDSEKKESPEDFKEEIRKHLFSRGKEGEETKTIPEKICGVVCSAVMSVGIVSYLLIGILTNLWHPYWIILPIAALLCGIIGIIFDLCNREKRRKKQEKGENPYCGSVCGLIMLICIGAYLLLGAIRGLWHPFWIIVVSGALLCGIIGSICEISSHKK